MPAAHFLNPIRMLVGLLLFLVASIQQVHAFDPPAILLEWSQGSATQEEWVEILVIQDHLDMRGWELGDDNSGRPFLVFGEEFADLRSGTLILVYNYGLGQRDPRLSAVQWQTTYLPCRERLFTPEATAFSTINWNNSNAFGNTNEDDNPILRNANYDIVHDWDFDNLPAFRSVRPGARQGVRYIGTTAAGVANPALWQRFARDDQSITPGRFNTPEQDAWAQRLQDAACNAASGFVASASPIEVCAGSRSRLRVNQASGQPLEPGSLVRWEPADQIEGDPTTAEVQTRPLSQTTTFRAIVTVGNDAGLAEITVRTVPNRLRIDVFQTPQPTDGQAELVLVARGGTRPYRYSVDGGDNFSTLSRFRGLGTNRTYRLVVTEASGCEMVREFDIR